MTVTLEYGLTGIDVDLPDARVDIIEPRHVDGLADEASSFVDDVRRPIGAAPLRTLIAPGERLAGAFARQTAMVACREPYPIEVTSNSGAPLDQNLYQAVKGISAAAQIVAEDGLVIVAASCQDGFPAHGNFRRLLQEHISPRALLDTILQDDVGMFDQWQAQLLALTLLKARVGAYCEIPADDVRRSHLEPVDDIGKRVVAELDCVGPDARIPVLPEGQ